MKLTRFWFVWNPAGSNPRHRHSSKASAMTEAKRLARLVPGDQFIVLKAIGGHVAKAVEPDEIKFVAPDPEDIPF